MYIIEYCCIFVMHKFAFNNTIVYSIVSIAFHNEAFPSQNWQINKCCSELRNFKDIYLTNKLSYSADIRLLDAVWVGDDRQKRKLT